MAKEIQAYPPDVSITSCSTSSLDRCLLYTNGLLELMLNALLIC